MLVSGREYCFPLETMDAFGSGIIDGMEESELWGLLGERILEGGGSDTGRKPEKELDRLDEPDGRCLLGRTGIADCSVG